MLRRLIGRLGAAGLLLLLVSFLVFSLVSMAPGSLETTLLGARPASPELIHSIRLQYHLDDPFLLRYLRWLTEAAHLDFGRSIVTSEPVSSAVSARAAVSAELAVLAFLVAAMIGVPAGLAAAAWRGRAADRAITLAAILGMSAPPFAVGTLLIYLFGVRFPVLPVYGAGDGPGDRLLHLALPAVALGAGLAALVVRQTRAAALGVLDQDYLTFARARGLSRVRVQTTYALRNVALPIISSLGLVLIVALPGAILVEVVFSLPGVGSMMVESVGAKDVPVVQALAIFTALYVVVVNTGVDLCSLLIDPRLRDGAAR
ncbi:ABC transporter permease [Catellatospora tritici]|uniref:ABC transporter permease n=1 Tax=Catellatospora tritici TaxID=2851566 RepID=UPI001C2D4449|nr:ABC transporter permease [Catellatospora tritici]MBV1849959.1 ABC transporter permease [Catellatospora tritici]